MLIPHYDVSGQHDIIIECAKQVGEVITITDTEKCDTSTKPVATVKQCEMPSCFELDVYHGRCDTPCGEVF